MPRSFETPLGVKDYTPESFRKIETIINGARSIANQFSYQGIKTPAIEYYQTVGLNSQIREDELIRFTGPLGRMLIIRPDLTTPIARIVASTYRELDPPFRFFSYGDVYRNDSEGLIEEKTQVDFELIGEKSLAADGEIINIAAKIIMNFTGSHIRITLGHTKIMTILLEEIIPDTQKREELFRALISLDYVTYRNIVSQLSVPDESREKLLEILTIKGKLESILKLESWHSEKEEWRQIFAEIREIQQILSDYNLGDQVIFDPSLVGRHKYYTGIIFNIYAQGSPYKIASGGRYDGLIGSFGRDLSATGMAVDVVELSKIQTKG
jgi:ATP phosphoribosyltransferase regulatory subunit